MTDASTVQVEHFRQVLLWPLRLMPTRRVDHFHGAPWEILRDLIQALSGGNGIYTIEDIFRQMSEATPEFAVSTLSRISDLGVQLLARTATNR